MIRPGTSVVEFFARFPDEAACLKHMFEVRWGQHTPCPKCGRFGRWTPVKGRKNYQHACRQQISVLAKTVSYRSNLSLMAWFYGMLLFANSSAGMRMGFVRRQLGLGTKSTARLCRLIRLQMSAYDRPRRVGGPGKKVYIDETFLKYVVTEPCEGSRAAPKVIMGFACDGVILAGIIADRRRETTFAAIKRFVRPGSVLVTDNHASYKHLSISGWEHVTVNHAVFWSDFRGNTLNEIETYWRVLKRALSSYRMVEEGNLWLYLAEVEFRYNLRKSQVSTFDHLISSFPQMSPQVLAELRSRYDWR